MFGRVVGQVVGRAHADGAERDRGDDRAQQPRDPAERGADRDDPARADQAGAVGLAGPGGHRGSA